MLAATRTRRRPRRNTASCTSTACAVGRELGVGLEPARAPLQRPCEGRERVLGEIGAGAPVGEGDRRHNPRVCRPGAAAGALK